MNTQIWTWLTELDLAYGALWGIEVPVGAPRFWPDHGISWEFFFGFVYV